MDKASIIKDAIDYIQVLQEQESRMVAELSQLDIIKEEKTAISVTTEEDRLVLGSRKKTSVASSSSQLPPGSPGKPSIEVMEVRALLLPTLFSQAIPEVRDF